MEEKKYSWAFPHVKGIMSTGNRMKTVLLGLLPAVVFSAVHFGPRALLQILICVVACMLTEFTWEAFADRPLAVTDGSAAVTGVLLAFWLPPQAPLYYGAIGGIFAIAVIKMLFGGIGKNRLNPALSGCCLLFVLFPEVMRDYRYGEFGSFTLLGVVLNGSTGDSLLQTTVDPLPLLFGSTNGALGTVCAIALLAGALLLLATGVARLRIPGLITLSFVAVLALFGGRGFDELYLTTQVLGGGFLLGAFFMATDYTTSPITKRAQTIYGIFIGIAAAVLRIYGFEEAICYAILLGNLLTPLLDAIAVPKPFGRRRPVRVSRK